MFYKIFYFIFLLFNSNCQTINVTTAINRHNKYRNLHQSGNLIWNSSIANKAQTWTNNCIFGHDPSTKYGENIYATWGSFSNNTDFIKNAIDLWYSEVKYYNYSKPGFSSKTGHFTQVVWKNTKRLGCGVKKCKDGMVIISCQYDPVGNYIGQFKENVLPIKSIF